MKHFKTHRGAFKRKLKKFGDLITFDFMDTEKVYHHGFLMEREILIIRDRFTGIIWAYPTITKEKDDVVRAFRKFVGRRAVRETFSDQAPEFKAAMKELKIPLDK